MLIALNENRDRLWAKEISRNEEPFCCPACQEKVQLRKGQIRVHHFAHFPQSVCTYGVGETEAHRKAKESIQIALQAKGITSFLEAPLGDVRPDVLAMLANNLVAIEVQASNISLDEIVRRTSSYSQRGIAIIWILCEPIPDHGIRQRFHWHQRFLHGMYFGRVYYYQHADNVRPVHFNTAFGESGRLQTIKYPQWGESVISISNTNLFIAKYREPYSYETRGKVIKYPSAKLWMEQSAKWWD